MNANDILNKQKELSEQLKEYEDQLTIELGKDFTAKIKFRKENGQPYVSLKKTVYSVNLNIIEFNFEKLKKLFNWLNEIGVVKTFPDSESFNIDWNNAKIKEYEPATQEIITYKGFVKELPSQAYKGEIVYLETEPPLGNKPYIYTEQGWVLIKDDNDQR